jgi:hypothetical protein
MRFDISNPTGSAPLALSSGCFTPQPSFNPRRMGSILRYIFLQRSRLYLTKSLPSIEWCRRPSSRTPAFGARRHVQSVECNFAMFATRSASATWRRTAADRGDSVSAKEKTARKAVSMMLSCLLCAEHIPLGQNLATFASACCVITPRAPSMPFVAWVLGVAGVGMGGGDEPPWQVPCQLPRGPLSPEGPLGAE